MPMVGAAMASKILADFTSAGFVGVNSANFAMAFSTGTVESFLLGQAFTTTDIGLTANAGAGAGVGLSGIAAPALSVAIQAALLLSFGQIGKDTPTVCDAIAEAVVAEIAKATLTSTHAPVYSGMGTVDVGPSSWAGIDGGAWGSAIETAGLGFGFLGANWPDFASAVGQECAIAWLAGVTGTVTITGSPPGSPSGGSGVGSGVIS